jgi:hypothetical protein
VLSGRKVSDYARYSVQEILLSTTPLGHSLKGVFNIQAVTSLRRCSSWIFKKPQAVFEFPETLSLNFQKLLFEASLVAK